jgi:hypothetical protein
MKKFNFIYCLSLCILGLSVVISCTKEGPPGKDGLDGEKGIDGSDGTATCIQCHDNSQTIFSKSIQWEASMHAKGGNFFRNSTDCAPCHTSQGFLERMAEGTQTTAAAISNPNPINCYTCHEIHKTFTPADWALTHTEVVDYWHTGGSGTSIDLGSGNLCANCHQARPVNPWPETGSTQEYTVTNFRYGPHYSPAGNMVSGIGGYEISGDLTYTNSPHSNTERGCVTCHMGEPVGVTSGGHQMTPNANGCIDCHPNGIQAELNLLQAEFAGYMETLFEILQEKGIIMDDGYLMGNDGVNRASANNPANLTADELGAFYNYKFVYYDHSGGVHNYKYARALLLNTINAIQ